MNISVSQQVFVFFGMVICGILCGVVFDVFRGLRRYHKSARSIVAMQDLLFWAIELTVVYMVAFSLNYAHVRAFEAVALVIGSWIYFMTMSRYVVRFVSVIISFAVRTALVISKPFLAVAGWIYMIIYKVFSFILSKLSPGFLSIKSRILKTKTKAKNFVLTKIKRLKKRPKKVSN